MAKKPRIVIIGAGMAGLTAANKLYTSCNDLFELVVVEGGDRIGGRINTSEFCGDRIEMGATWIHGIIGSPIHKIAKEIHALESHQPWECMDGLSDDPKTTAEGGFELNASLVDPVSNLFKNLMDSCATRNGVFGDKSVGGFLRQGLDAYLDSCKNRDEVNGYGKWSRTLLEEAIFAMHEHTQRTYTSASDLFDLDYEAEREYRMFPGEEITIPKGYSSIIQHLASVLPLGVIQLGRKVTRIEWQSSGSRPVKIWFCDGSFTLADHVIVTVSLGVLKAGTCRQDSDMFDPPLPYYKTEAITRLGYGVVNKLFLQWSTQNGNNDTYKFPSLQIVFHKPDSELKQDKIPRWMRRTASFSPIYNNSTVLLAWFAGEEAFELETLGDEEIIKGVSATLHECDQVRFVKVLKTKWGSDPLFLGSYSYVAVGSSGADLDTMAEPLPKIEDHRHRPLQILFAGEATHRTHYSTTHGAYLSGLREANRLLQHYHCVGELDFW